MDEQRSEGRGVSACQKEMIAAGIPYPRTCPTCGLFGKCVKEASTIQESSVFKDSDKTDVLPSLEDLRARTSALNELATAAERVKKALDELDETDAGSVVVRSVPGVATYIAITRTEAVKSIAREEAMKVVREQFPVTTAKGLRREDEWRTPSIKDGGDR